MNQPFIGLYSNQEAIVREYYCFLEAVTFMYNDILQASSDASTVALKSTCIVMYSTPYISVSNLITRESKLPTDTDAELFFGMRGSDSRMVQVRETVRSFSPAQQLTCSGLPETATRTADATCKLLLKKSLA